MLRLVLLSKLLYLPNVRAIQYKLGPERLTRLGNSNVLRLPVLLDQSLKYTRCTPLGCKDVEIRQFDCMTKTQFFYSKPTLKEAELSCIC